MAKDLPPVTPEDVEAHPDRVRKTPKGGYAWKCAYCNMFASSETNAGKYVCYRHGGNRKVQKDPKARAKAKAKGKRTPRPNGRPLKSGYYSRSEAVPVKDVVEAYLKQGFDPDNTDADMLHLRARVENLLAMEPQVTEWVSELDDLLTKMREWKQSLVADEPGGITVHTVALQLDRLDDLRKTLEEARSVHRRFMGFSAEIEARHAEIVKLAKVRAETRFKDRATRELTVVSLLVGRLMEALSDQLPPDLYDPLVKRLEQDLDRVPKRVLELPAASANMRKD